jgi:metal-responsive CopG/Arc/MetJ family transcriptional regulator
MNFKKKPKVRVNVCFDSEILAGIDEATKSGNFSRSGFVNMVLKQYIENFIIHVQKDIVKESNKRKVSHAV